MGDQVSDTQPKRDRGRPTDYRPEFVEQARARCAKGATNAELAEFFGVSLQTLHNWRGCHPEFVDALKVGKAEADDRVEQSLYARAMGYSFPAVKIFMPAGADAPVYAPYIEHIPPDATSMIFWLKNRRPAEWREKQEIKHGGTVTLETLINATGIGEKKA